MFFSALTQPFIAVGQEDGQYPTSEEDVPMSTANIFSKLSDELGLKPDLDWGESFGYGEGDEAKVGKDMYMVIYKKVHNEPEKKTMKDVSGKYGMNEGDTWLVLNGDYTPIMDRKPDLTQEELLNKVSEMQREYGEMRDTYQLEANIKAAVEPSEMFANGDLGDSGFDLIHDLSLIEEILFLKTDPMDIGKSYVSPNGGLSGYGQAPVTSGELTAPAGIKTPSDSSDAGGGGGTDTTSQSGAGAQTAGPQTVKSGQAEPGLNPNVCFIENKYSDSLAEFDEKSLTDTNLKNLSAGQTPSKPYSAPGQGISSGAPLSDMADKSSEPLLQKKELDLPPVQSAEPDNWLKNRYCEGFFCLEINFVKSPAKSAFANADNCIACHVEKTNDILKETINHSLVPTKAPGNLGESAECKKAMGTAFSSVSMNVYAIGMPIKTPINDDLMFGTNIDDEWANYCESVAFFPFDMCKETEEDAPFEEPVSLVDRATTQAAVQISEDATQEELSKRVSAQIAGYEAAQKKEMEAIQKSQQTDSKAVLYQPLKYELDSMNYHFKNIQNILHSLHESIVEMPGIQACNDLKDKKECE